MAGGPSPRQGRLQGIPPGPELSLSQRGSPSRAPRRHAGPAAAPGSPQASPRTAGPGRAGTQTRRPQEAPRSPPPQGTGLGGVSRARCGPARPAGPARDGAIQRQHPRGRTPTDLVEAALGREDGDVAVEAGAGPAGHGGAGGRPSGSRRASPAETAHRAPREYCRVTRPAQAPKRAQLAHRHAPAAVLRMLKPCGAPCPCPPPPTPRARHPLGRASALWRRAQPASCRDMRAASCRPVQRGGRRGRGAAVGSCEPSGGPSGSWLTENLVEDVTECARKYRKPGGCITVSCTASQENKPLFQFPKQSISTCSFQ